MAQPKSAPDVEYENDDVCILNPDATRGIVVFALFESENFCSDTKLPDNKQGILSDNERRSRNGEPLQHDTHIYGDLDHDNFHNFR